MSVQGKKINAVLAGAKAGWTSTSRTKDGPRVATEGNFRFPRAGHQATPQSPLHYSSVIRNRVKGEPSPRQ